MAIIVCDAVWVDPTTGKNTILGVFSALVGREFPLKLPHLTVYLALTDTTGVVPLRIRLVDVDEVREPVQEKEWKVDFPDPITIVEDTVRRENCRFPEPGDYRLQLLSNSELVIERRLMVIADKETPDE